MPFLLSSGHDAGHLWAFPEPTPHPHYWLWPLKLLGSHNTFWDQFSSRQRRKLYRLPGWLYCKQDLLFVVFFQTQEWYLPGVLHHTLQISLNSTITFANSSFIRLYSNCLVWVCNLFPAWVLSASLVYSHILVELHMSSFLRKKCKK